MLPRTQRLQRPGLFKRLYAAKKSVLSKLFTLYVLPRQPGSSPRSPLVGFVVAKKVHNRATKRNLVKRRLREAYRSLCRTNADLNIDSSVDREQANLGQWYAMVFVVHNQALAASYEEICKTVNESVLKAEKKYGQANPNKTSQTKVE